MIGFGFSVRIRALKVRTRISFFKARSDHGTYIEEYSAEAKRKIGLFGEEQKIRFVTAPDLVT